MTRVTALVGTMMLVLGLAVGVAAQTPPTPQPGGTLQQEGFTPIEQLPPQDQLPAAPLLISAYVFVVVALFAYVFSVARRLVNVQQQMERLDADLKRGRRV